MSAQRMLELYMYVILLQEHLTNLGILSIAFETKNSII